MLISARIRAHLSVFVQSYCFKDVFQRVCSEILFRDLFQRFCLAIFLKESIWFQRFCSKALFREFFKVAFEKSCSNIKSKILLTHFSAFSTFFEIYTVFAFFPENYEKFVEKFAIFTKIS